MCIFSLLGLGKRFSHFSHWCVFFGRLCFLFFAGGGGLGTVVDEWGLVVLFSPGFCILDQHFGSSTIERFIIQEFNGWI